MTTIRANDVQHFLWNIFLLHLINDIPFEKLNSDDTLMFESWYQVYAAKVMAALANCIFTATASNCYDSAPPTESLFFSRWFKPAQSNSDSDRNDASSSVSSTTDEVTPIVCNHDSDSGSVISRSLSEQLVSSSTPSLSSTEKSSVPSSLSRRSSSEPEMAFIDFGDGLELDTTSPRTIKRMFRPLRSAYRPACIKSRVFRSSSSSSSSQESLVAQPENTRRYGTLKRWYKTKSKHNCGFCRKNGEPSNVYTSHNVKDSDGFCDCPYLSKLVCKLCGATGKLAHTISYCPEASKVREVHSDDPVAQTKLSNFAQQKNAK